MSLRLDMIRRAARGGVAAPAGPQRVAEFLRGQITSDGSFANRAGKGELYYTAFGLMALAALGAEVPAGRIAEYLRRFHNPEPLDLVSLACLARCRACLPADAGADEDAAGPILQGLEAWRRRVAAQAVEALAYECFLALGAYQDLDAPPPSRELLAWVRPCRSADGGFANRTGGPSATAPTAAAVCVARELEGAGDAAAGRWLSDRWDSAGGFLAHPSAPLADLLSTAVALHGLEAAGAPLDPARREATLAFVRGLQRPDGGFRGLALDDRADCEYTFYGLLALGHVADRAQ